MGSHRSTWSGSIQLGLLNVPVTLAKATEDIREKGIKDVCGKHKIALSRNERCDSCLGPPESKAKGVEKSDGSFHVLSETQWNFIEGATKLSTLEILDVQPLDVLPLEYTTATYFIRPDKKAAGAAQPFRVLYEALERQDYGCVTKLANSSKQKLAVIRASRGVLLLQVVPHVAELREPGEQELAHNGVTPDAAMVDMAVQLLDSYRNPHVFDHADDKFADEGLKLREAAVEKVLAGEPEPEPAPEPKVEPAHGLMEALQASIDQHKGPRAKA